MYFDIFKNGSQQAFFWFNNLSSPQEIVDFQKKESIAQLMVHIITPHLLYSVYGKWIAFI